jgi:hypothetical protein
VVKQWGETDKLLTEVSTILTDNAVFGSGSMGNSINEKKAKFDGSYQDTKALADTLRIAVNNLKPVVEGLEASGSKTDKVPEGSVKFIGTTSVKYDNVVEAAKKATVKEDPATTDPPKDVPLMTAAEVVPKPAGKAMVATGTPAAGSNAFVDGVKAADTVVDKSEGLLSKAEAKLKGTDAEKKEAKKELLRVDEGSISKGIADGIKTQTDILAGIGQASDISTKPAPAAK